MLDVARWLAEQGLGHHAAAFAENGIAGDVLGDLTDADLRELGLNLGDRRRLLKAIAALSAGSANAPTGAAEPTARPAVPREAERRQLTVLFVDLVASTELAARLDPEDMARVIRAYQGCCSDAVRRWDGHIAKYMGDGVLAYFGWPQAHEDEAERAVRAGLAIIEALARLETPASVPLAARIGIATGLVMVGELIGEGAAQERTVVGETPNLAARLQALAAPGSVVISQATRRLVGGLFALSDLGPQRLKGFAEPLAAWRVDGESHAEGRFDALHGERLTPLVGREHEVGILLERWAWAKDGDGQVVLLAGEPGIGKSRMIRSLRDHLADEPRALLSHYCSPYHTTVMGPQTSVSRCLAQAGARHGSCCLRPTGRSAMTMREHEAAIASAATLTGADDSDTIGLSRRDVLQLAGSAVFVVGVPTGTTRAATSPGEEAFAMASVRLTVNGQARQLELDPRQSLLDVLRETLDLTGTKKGCNQGACGACTVLLNGKRIVSCLTLAAMHDGAEIETIEGLANGDELHPLQAAFVDHDGLQCGFCTPGQIMSGLGCIAEGHAGSSEEIQFWMSGNICRCGAYPGIVAAIADAAGRT